ncbi:hypothetical protein [Nonomuraea endophytica]|uniref:hypothetical protein n=1 Tax=Nonomuraea endophytica TaxID=714136 RepID=UPI0037CBA4BB
MDAERLAVQGFGAVEEIAPGHQGELTACAGRRGRKCDHVVRAAHRRFGVVGMIACGASATCRPSWVH